MNRNPDEIRLSDLPPGEARDLLASGVPAWLPVNPVEYHGPHLTLWNDGFAADAIARDLHARLRREHPEWPFVTLPDLGVGCGTVPGPGSRHDPFGEVRSAVVRACHALADLGAQRVVLSTFHGDPMHNLALQAGVEALAGRGVRAFVPMHRILAMMIDPPRDLFDAVVAPVTDARERATLRAELPYDFHGGFLETSFLLHYRPDTVSLVHRTLPPCAPFGPVPLIGALARAAAFAAKGKRSRAAIELDYAAHGLGWFALRPFTGYSSRPHLANAASGGIVAQAIQEDLASVARDVLEHGAEPPEPPMRWLLPLTLDGRIDLSA